MFTFGMYLYLLVILAVISFVLYALFFVLKSIKLRNVYLKQILDELRIMNNKNNS